MELRSICPSGKLLMTKFQPRYSVFPELPVLTELAALPAFPRSFQSAVVGLPFCGLESLWQQGTLGHPTRGTVSAPQRVGFNAGYLHRAEAW